MQLLNEAWHVGRKEERRMSNSITSLDKQTILSWSTSSDGYMIYYGAGNPSLVREN